MLEGGPELHSFSHILQNRKKSLFILGTTSLQGEQVKKKKNLFLEALHLFLKSHHSLYALQRSGHAVL